jgi:hypothetical protein
MTAPLAALSYEDIGASRNSVPRKGKRLNLANGDRIRQLDAFDEWRRITKGEHCRRRLALQRKVEKLWLLGHAPGDESNPKSRTAAREKIELTGQPLFIAIAAAQDAEAAGVTHCGGQARISDQIHRPKEDWMNDPESFGQGSCNRHAISL